MGGTLRPQTITTETQGICEQTEGQQKLCAKRGVACLVPNAVKRIRTEEPDERNLHVRICGEGAGQPVPLPGRELRTKELANLAGLWIYSSRAARRFW